MLTHSDDHMQGKQAKQIFCPKYMSWGVKLLYCEMNYYTCNTHYIIILIIIITHHILVVEVLIIADAVLCAPS